MKNLIPFLLLVSIAGEIFSQTPPKVGEKAPKINITDYIQNIPVDKNLENKFVVLEFWATWCAPCLGAAPHLNELMQMFTDKKEVVFLSMTYEKPEKVRKTLEKIKFETAVVSDQSKETETKFGVKSIPQTVLIDNKGIIKWMGDPMELDSIKMERFLSGDTYEVQSGNKEQADEKAAIESDSDMAFKLLKDKTTPNLFTVTKSKSNDDPLTLNSLPTGRYVELNNSLATVLSRIIQKPDAHIRVPAELAKDKYNLIYKNATKASVEIHTRNLKDSLLAALNLVENISRKKTEVYQMRVIDPSKLQIPKNQEEDIHFGDNATHFIASNAPIASLVQALQDYYSVIITDETGLTKNLDLILCKGSFIDLSNELKEYGLRLDKSIKEVWTSSL